MKLWRKLIVIFKNGESNTFGGLISIYIDILFSVALDSYAYFGMSVPIWVEFLPEMDRI